MSLKLSKLINKILRPVAKKRGITCVEILSHWSDIAGDKYAKLAIPYKVTFYKDSKNNQIAVLFLKVSRPAAALEISYLVEMILSRISMYYGYKAIDQIKIVHV